MSAGKRKLLVISAAALGWDLIQQYAPAGLALKFQPLNAVFPSLTCVAQATFRTASQPGNHSVLSNGFYSRELRKVMFWEQSAALVEGRRIWEDFRKRGKRVGMMFWQQSLGEQLDLVLSPRPIHKHSGGMIQDCLCRPAGLYEKVCGRLGKSFNLMHYWGPLASAKASQWITRATCEVLANAELAPDLLMTYLPHLDYDLQRYGPGDRRAKAACLKLLEFLEQLTRTAAANHFDYLIYGDYAIGAVTEAPVFPNRILREAGLLQTRQIRGMAYPDFFHSEAFAMVDHEVALVFAIDAAAARRAAAAFQQAGIAEAILDGEAMAARGLKGVRGPDLLLCARAGSWFAYPWWSERREAPDYATHIDIHNKPGYDPAELFFGWPPISVCTRPERIRGSHGLAGNDRRVAWASSFQPGSEPGDLAALAGLVERRLQS
jgi:hypothetical protein